MKPKIKKFNLAWWECAGNGYSAFGMSISSAFKSWEMVVKMSKKRCEQFERDIL